MNKVILMGRLTGARRLDIHRAKTPPALHVIAWR